MSMPPDSRFALEPANTGSTARESEVLLSKPFLLMLCVQFCFGLSYSTFFLLPKFLARAFHANADTIGAVASTALFAGVLAVPFIGAIIDRHTRRSVIVLGAFANALSASAFAFVHSVAWPLFALRAANGITYALVFNGIVTWAADLAPAKKLGQAIGLCGAAGMLANALAPAVGEAVADSHGWPWVFALGAAAALASALLALGIREPRLPAHVALISAENSTAHSALRLVLDRRRAGAFVCSMAAGAGFGVMFTFTQPFALQLGASKVSGLFLGYTACAVLVRLGLGSVADRLGRRQIAFGALVLYGLVACMTSQLRPNYLFALGAGMGLAHGLLYPALNALAVDGVSRARRGAVMTYFLGCFNGGFALCVLGMGWIAKSHGYPIVFVATGLLIWSSLLFLPKAQRLSA
ncbi:MAG TPA: MFS transporter [Polyangiaceae bacterium]